MKTTDRSLEQRVRKDIIAEANKAEGMKMVHGTKKRFRLSNSAYYMAGIYAKCATEYLNEGDLKTARRYAKEYKLAEDINDRLRKRMNKLLEIAVTI